MTLGELRYRVDIWQRHTARTDMADVMLALGGHPDAALLDKAVARFKALQREDQARRPALMRKAANGL